MKAKIHPKVHVLKIACACGHIIETVSTSADLSISVCSHCHPYFTGKQKLMDTAGRIEKFQKRYGKPGATEAKKA